MTSICFWSWVIATTTVLYGGIVWGLARGNQKVQKRMIWGTQLSDPFSYPSVGYFAYISNGFHCNRHLLNLKILFGLYSVCKPDTTDLKCGGAMIMPNIVQTACHCLSSYQWVNETYLRSVPNNGFETWMSVFHGYTRVEDMVEEGVWSKKFWVHQKCGKVLGRGITHDYGLILLNQPVLMKRSHLRMAPVYSIDYLHRMYYETLTKRSVCLFIGFGRYYFVTPGVGGIASPVLMHGWRLIQSYWWCYWECWIAFEGRRMEPHGYSYTEKATWVCTTFFGKMRTHLLSGDSGSPVSCNNQYFAMNSFAFNLYVSTNHSLEMIGPVVFSSFENSIEYRASLTKRLMELEEQEELAAPYFRPNLSMFYQQRFAELDREPPNYTMFSFDVGASSPIRLNGWILLFCLFIYFVYK